MGHNPGFPCLYSPDNHDGVCSTPVVGPLVDLGKTRWFEVTEVSGFAYWRTNATAAHGCQVEILHRDGRWKTSWLFDTEAEFERNLRRDKPVAWREITAEEVPNA